jgi:hypothetical protein
MDLPSLVLQGLHQQFKLHLSVAALLVSIKDQRILDRNSSSESFFPAVGH